MTKRVLVTGGAGFLGSHLCERLLEDNCEVLCVDNFFTGSRRNIAHLFDNRDFELLRHDVTRPLHAEVDEIYNLACPASPIHYQFDPVQTTKTSVMGVINMLGIAKRVKAKILQASTSEVYGDPIVHPLEIRSEHPLADAILRGAEAKGLKAPKVAEFSTVTGQGVRGTVDGRVALLGNARLMESANVDIAPLAESAEQRRKNVETVMLLASDGKLAGFVSVADPIKPGAADAIANLHALGLKIVMATGDNATTAKAVASQLGIDEVRAGMRPEEKLH